MQLLSRPSSLRRRLGALTAGALAATGLVAVAAAAPAAAVAFGEGNVVVLRVGSGAAALSNAATATVLDEYAPDGTLVQSVPMPDAAGGTNPVALSGTATSEGALARSADGRYLTFVGYAAVPGTAAIAATASATTPRVVARVGADGTVDSTTTITDAFSANNPRGVVTDDGTRFWAAGANSGIRLATLGGSTTAAVSGGTTVTNFRVPAIVDGQLYVSSSSGAAVGVNRVGTGLPTAGAGLTSLVAPASPYAFVLLDRDPAVPGVDSLYVADDTATTGGILKYSFDGTAWTARGSFRPAASSARGLTGAVQPDGSVRLVATTSATAPALVSVTDTAGSDVTFAGTGTTLATSPANTAFRGVALAPVAPAGAVAPAVTTQPADTAVPSGGTATLTVAATGTAPLSYQWFQGEAGDTSTPVGTDAPSFTTPALAQTTAYWVRVTNAAGSADSRTVTVTVQVVTPTNTAPTVAPVPLEPLALTLGDPWNPPAPRTVTVADAESAPSALSVTVTSSDPAVATGAASGSADVRSVDVTPVGTGTATLTVTVSDGDLTAATTMDVAVGAALPAGTVNLYGISDASTAVDLGNGFMAVGDDETNTLRVYDRTRSRYPASSLDLRAAGLALPDPGLAREIDVEASARSGSTVYWLGSQGQNSSGSTRLNRQLLFTTTVTGTGSGAVLAVGGSYHGLRTDLVAWDAANGDRYGLAAAAAVAPEPAGVNLEGAELAPDGTTLYLGFRGPLVDGGKALVVPLTNAADLVTANPTAGVTAAFGAPIEWDLGGRGVREIRKNATNDYVVVAGPPGPGTGAAGEFALYTWNGDPARAPLPRAGSLDSFAAQGSVESVVDVPSPLTAASQVQLLTDSGDTVWYGGTTITKDLTTVQFRKSVTRSVALGAAPACSADDVTTGSVQGAGDVSPVVGRSVTVQGTVVGDYEGAAPNLRGFYVQDTGDGDPATSDGLFVFNNIGGTSPNLVSLGQVVQVTGTVSEFNGQTQVTAATIETCPAAGTVAPTDVTLPRAAANDLERYEGMLVRFHQTLSVTEHFQLGRFGQVVVSSGGRLRQPTAVFRAGDPRVAQLQAANDLDRVIVDDALNNQNPDPIVFGRNGSPLSAANTLRGGDTVTDPVGVLTYTFAGNAASGNAFRLRPVNALGGTATFLGANPRPEAAPAVGGNLTVASANLLNFFNTFGNGACTFGLGGAPADCRGAENATEYQRQLAKEVAALTSLDADVVGLMEVENDGYGPTSAIQALVDALNAADGAGTWAFVDPDAATGVVDAAGTDAIKPAMLYKPARVTPVAGTTFTDVTPTDLFERRPLAQTFLTGTGAKVTVVTNHFKSKGTCPAAGTDPANEDSGDGQSCWNGRRTQQATELARWIGDVVVPATGVVDVLVVGDLNSYAGEDPIAVLEAAGYVNLPKAFHGDEPYSFAFDGQWGYLDHVLASPTLLPKATGVEDVHINADEPSVLDYNTNFKSAGQVASLYAPDRFRTSDHDPVVAGFRLGVPASFTGAPPATATVGTEYAAQLDPAGTAPVTFAVTAGALPDGVVLSSAGALSGSPTTAGTFSFDLTAVNGYGEQTRSFTVVVAKAATAVTVTSSAPDVLYRGAVRWTATVRRTGAGVPAGTPVGTVQFKVNGANLGAPVALVDGVATSPATSGLTPGASTVTAVYAGGANDLAATGTYSQVVRFAIRIVAPTAGASFRAGANVPVQFQLRDAVGTVPDLVSAAYLLTCRTTVSAAGAQTLAPTCVTSYDTRTKLFASTWRPNRRGGTGEVTLTVGVAYPGVADRQTGTVVIRLVP